jgi:hypothetical protein
LTIKPPKCQESIKNLKDSESDADFVNSTYLSEKGVNKRKNLEKRQSMQSFEKVSSLATGDQDQDQS